MNGWLDVFGVRCVGCRHFGSPLCDDCRSGLKPVGTLGSGPPGVDRLLAGYTYEGAARKLVLDLKLRHHRPMAGPLVDGILATIWREGLQGTVLTWVPGRWKDTVDRGFDHAHLLATLVARRTGLPLTRLLRRTGARPDQTELDRNARLANLKGAFRADPRVKGLEVVVIDDLITTGATAGACAEALKAQGARSVEVIAACQA